MPDDALVRRWIAGVMRTGHDRSELTASMIVRAYALGIFPMATARGSDTVHWVAPAMRGFTDMMPWAD